MFLISVGTFLVGLPGSSSVVKAERLYVVEDMGCTEFYPVKSLNE